MKKEDLLKILYKYGFHSLNKEPFLYEGKLGLGYCYTYKDKIYGSLTRVFIPNSIEEAEKFISEYYNYKKNNSKNNIEIELSDYKIENPILKYITIKEEVTEPVETLKTEVVLDSKERSYLRKIRRTALLLIKIIEEKIKVQNTTYTNLVQLNDNYQQLYTQLEQKKQEYNKIKEEIKIKQSINDEVKDYTSDILEMTEYVKNASKEEIEEYIKVLTNFLKSLESSESFIHNKYELIRIPLEIESIKKQIEILEEASKKKKGMFAKKETVEELLKNNSIEESTKKIVSFKHYNENELKRIEEKYAVIPDVDIRTIGDFFIEFDNLSIKEPEIKEEIVVTEEKENIRVFTYEETMEQLETHFKNRSKEEQRILVLYHSILKTIRIYLELDQKELIKEQVKEFIDLLEQQNNILFKIKYFKNINTSSVDLCIESIKEELAKINQIESEKILASINVFFKDGKKITDRRFIEASNKKMFAPTQRIDENEITYLATLKQNTEVYFIPIEITYDFEQEDTLIQKTNQPFFLIDMQKNDIISYDSDIIKVTDYSVIKEKTELGIIVKELKSNKINQYQKVTIGGKNE